MWIEFNWLRIRSNSKLCEYCAEPRGFYKPNEPLARLGIKLLSTLYTEIVTVSAVFLILLTCRLGMLPATVKQPRVQTSLSLVRNCGSGISSGILNVRRIFHVGIMQTQPPSLLKSLSLVTHILNLLAT
jgi:hypothetical protein